MAIFLPSSITLSPPPIRSLVGTPARRQQPGFFEAGDQVRDEVVEVILAPHRLPQRKVLIELLTPLGSQASLQTPDQRIELRLREGETEPGRGTDDLFL